MKEWNRWNVALTRAKSVLYVVGSLDSFLHSLYVSVVDIYFRMPPHIAFPVV